MADDQPEHLPGSPAAASGRRLPRGRHDLPREFVARTQRDRLIDAMARTVAEKGYAATSPAEVCTAAGVSTRAFYQQFSGKEDCFLAAFDRGVELLQRTVAAAYGQPGRWPQRMHRGLNTLLRLLAAEPAFAALAIVEVLAAGAAARERRRLLLRGFAIFFEGARHRDDVPHGVVEAVIAGVYGVIYEFVAAGRAADLPGQLPGLTYLTVVPFLGPAAAAEVAAEPLD